MSAAARERSCKVVALLRFEKKGGVGHKRGQSKRGKVETKRMNHRINRMNRIIIKSATMQKALMHVRYLPMVVHVPVL